MTNQQKEISFNMAEHLLDICSEDPTGCHGDSSVGIAPCQFYDYPDIDDAGNYNPGGCQICRFKTELKLPEPAKIPAIQLDEETLALFQAFQTIDVADRKLVDDDTYRRECIRRYDIDPKNLQDISEAHKLRTAIMKDLYRMALEALYGKD